MGEESTSIGGSGKRNLQLDVLRGVAILLVVGRHLELPRPGGALGILAAGWFHVGWLGVDLFFVLSGFLIGGLLLSELDRHGTINVSRFLIRRGLKIYPPYFVFLAYLVAMPVAKALARGGDAWAVFKDMGTAIVPNLLFLQNYLGSPAGHTWSLAVEEHFYLLLPFVLVALAQKGRARSIVWVCLAAAPVCLMLRCASVCTNDPFAGTLSATHLRLDGLLFGVAIRGAAQYWPSRFLVARRWRGALVCLWVALWLPIYLLEPTTFLIRTAGLSATYVGGAALLLAVYHTRAADFGRWSRYVAPLATGLAWIGVYSYAIYLWHVTAMKILEREIGARVLTGTSGAAAPLAWLGCVVVIGMGAVVVGVIASKLVDWPVLRLRDRFFPSRSGSLPPAPARDHAQLTSPAPEPLCALTTMAPALRTD
jgi:peptidoglycan/LPS O-acetylase OafA/YrhL